MTKWKLLRGRQQGSATLEVLFLTPALLLLIDLAIVAGRVALLHAEVREAAQEAARSGTLARDDATANRTAHNNADNYAFFNRRDAICGTENSIVYDSPFLNNDPGTPQAFGTTSLYAVTVSCTIPAAKLFPGSTFSLTVSYTAYSPLDPYRCNGSVNVC